MGGLDRLLAETDGADCGVGRGWRHAGASLALAGRLQPDED